MDIAVICGHLDDETFMGGTIARYNAEGHNIHVLVLTESCSAGHLSGDRQPQYDQKMDEFLAAEKLLGGYKTKAICSFPDMQLDRVPHINLNRAIERFIDTTQPEMVFTHHPGDLNKDHRLVAESTFVAVRPVPGCPVKKVLCYEVPGNVECWGPVTQPFIPNTYVDITDTISKKLDAIREYQSELVEYPHPRSIHSVLNHAWSRGGEVQLEACEAFISIRDVI